MYFPFAFALGLIIIAWKALTPFFTALWNGIVAIFSVVASFFGTVFGAAWNAITFVWGLAVGFFNLWWNGIVNIFNAVVGFFSGVFSAAWNAIVAVFSPIVKFFKGIWDSIASIFTSIGKTVGDAIGGAFKTAVNGVLNFAAGMINGFIDAINGATDVINNIPGVKIGKIGKLKVNLLAEGGIISSPTLAMIGEGREPEAVIPLSKLGDMLNNDNNQTKPNAQPPQINVTVQVQGNVFGDDSSMGRLAIQIGQQLEKQFRLQGTTNVNMLRTN